MFLASVFSPLAFFTTDALIFSTDCYIETLGPINDTAREFLFKISLQSGDDREGSFLFQRISVLIQRFNAILLGLHDSFAQ